MTKQTRNIFLIIAGALILLNIIALIINHGSGPKNLAGALARSETTVKINEAAIPSYQFKNSVYIAAEDLQLFGFSVEKNKSEVHILNAEEDYSFREDYSSSLSHLKDGTNVEHTELSVYLNGDKIQAYTAKDYTLIPLRVLDTIGVCEKSDSSNAILCTLTSKNDKQANAGTKAQPDAVSVTPPTVEPNRRSSSGLGTGTYSGSSPSGTSVSGSKVIVLDPGHGKASQDMSSEEKKNSGWIYNEDRGQWGEWRHWKSGTVRQDCEGSGCSGRTPPGGDEWYPIGNGDRDTEPDINLQNCLAAKKYLEQKGYTVRLTRSSNNENPSITQRLTYCYPSQNTSASPDADAFVCVHSNAGGGSGTSYISLSGDYDQKGIPSDYAAQGNALGKAINDKIAELTELTNSGSIDGEPELIAFCKSPVICAYLEIGFFDNSSDLSILKSDSDTIGKAIAEGIDSYFN